MLENNNTSPTEMNNQQQRFNLTFRRDKQYFLGSPTITVLGNNNISCSLHSGESLSSLNPLGIYHLDISGANCKAVADFELKRDTVIDLKFNRMAGGIDVSINGVKQRQKKNKPKIIIAVACALIALVVLIGGVGDLMSAVNKSQAIVVPDSTFPPYGATFNLTKNDFERLFNASATKLAQKADIQPTQLTIDGNAWSSSVDSLTKGYNYTYVNSLYDIVVMATPSDKIFSLVCNVTNIDTLPLYMEMANIVDPNSQKLISKMISDNINIACYKNTQVVIGSYPNKVVIMLTSVSDQYKATLSIQEYNSL